MRMAPTKIEFGRSCFTHCCPRHGCKYGYDGSAMNNGKVCPMSAGLARPKYPNNNGCEYCEPEFAAVEAGKRQAEVWNTCDPESNISAEAAAQIAMAAITAYIQEQ